MYLLFDYNKKTALKNEKGFAIENTEDINKVFLSDRKGNNIILSKTNNNWIINDKYDVRDDAIKTLLSTIEQIEIQRPVSNTSFNNVIRQLATTGVKVEIYYHNNVKVYTVGSSTPDHLGTYMLMDDAENPYIVHIPGFNGFLSPRYGIQGYELNINNWRDNSIFKINSEEIQEISLLNYNEQEKSFLIQKEPLRLINNDSISIKYNINKTVEYFNNFSNIECEKYKGFEIDISSEKLLFKLNIKHQGKTDLLEAYSFSKTNKNSNNSKPNVERMYAKLNNGEYMLIQNYVFNKVFISIDDLKE
ncbi:MAG: DUF4340 domain-containing protein [Flavobacteriales bacterium]|jgi:hypothetical protein|nr:DUF4340 domain-containing protein [Flavobacteriales bacterium]